MSEDNKLYRLVFTGKLLPGHGKNKVVVRLQRMLNVDMATADRLVSGKHRQINKKLTLDRAEKLRLLILKQGAECVLLPIEDSFVTTQQLPMFVRSDEDNAKAEAASASRIKEQKEEQKSPKNTRQESISNIRNRSKALSKNQKLKYLIYALFLMVVEGLLIWNIKPAATTAECSNNVQALPAASSDAVASDQRLLARKLTVLENDTLKKIKILSLRTSLWFTENEDNKSPAQVSWIWIQGDTGITVREMNDSWGTAIRYLGSDDGFEFRSSGSDKIFYTDDDLFTNTRL